MTKHCYVFKGAGGYIAWYIGYAKFLQDNVDLSNASFAGTSAGSIIAVFLASEIPIQDVWNKWFGQILSDLPENFRFPSQEFTPIAKRHAKTLLTDDAFERTKGRIHVSLTNTQFQRDSISHFKTGDDLIECVMTSCHVPWIINGSATVEYGNRRYMDGSVCNSLGRTELYSPCGEKMEYIRIQTPYKSYEQIASLVRFCDMSFHYRNYIDGYTCAQKKYVSDNPTSTEI